MFYSITIVYYTIVVIVIAIVVVVFVDAAADDAIVLINGNVTGLLNIFKGRTACFYLASKLKCFNWVCPILRIFIRKLIVPYMFFDTFKIHS